VLTGRVDPAGRLPVAFPGAGDVQPLGPDTTSARRSAVSVVDPTPLYEFGHGLSYTPVAWGAAVAETSTWPTGGTLRLSVPLRNPHDRPASEVVQVYLHRPVAEVAQPVQRLVGFARVDLPPRAERTVEVELPADLASYVGRDGQRAVVPGAAQLWVAASAADVRSTVEVELVGSRRVVGFDRALQPVVTVSG
jgi:beta-glucosidase